MIDRSVTDTNDDTYANTRSDTDTDANSDADTDVDIDTDPIPSATHHLHPFLHTN